MALSKTDMIKYTETTAMEFLLSFVPKPIAAENWEIPWLPSCIFQLEDGGNVFTVISQILVMIQLHY